MNHDPDNTHLRDGLDASFGDGPPLMSPVDRLTAGRQAMRRRRLAGAAGASVAVSVVVAACFALLGPGGSGSQGAEPAGPVLDTSAQSEQTRSEQALAELEAEQAAAEARQTLEQLRKSKLVSNAFPAALDNDGSLVVKDGWEVTQQVPEPVGLRAPEASLGVVVTNGASTRWMLLTLERVKGGMSAGASADPAGKGNSRFEDWLASMVELAGGAQPDPLVTVGTDDQVVAGPGSTLVDVQEIDVIEGYTSPGDRVAEVRRRGQTWFAVIRGHGRGAEIIPVDADVLPESTLAALLTYVAQQADSGEGVR